MSEDRGKALLLARQAMLFVAQGLRVDADQLCETAIQPILYDKGYYLKGFDAVRMPDHGSGRARPCLVRLRRSQAFVKLQEFIMSDN